LLISYTLILSLNKLSSYIKNLPSLLVKRCVLNSFTFRS